MSYTNISGSTDIILLTFYKKMCLPNNEYLRYCPDYLCHITWSNEDSIMVVLTAYILHGCAYDTCEQSAGYTIHTYLYIHRVYRGTPAITKHDILLSVKCTLPVCYPITYINYRWTTATRIL